MIKAVFLGSPYHNSPRMNAPGVKGQQRKAVRPLRCGGVMIHDNVVLVKGS